ncbi:proton-conducting transporter membrane subunit [Azotobacter beijerinckii]|uniref:NADH-Ubiquinone oxidoreductase (Complex I), chain 5 N-terminus n=1 Tax=Azotobacter beijerinckii TaxID=170623 RepID=A0A1I4AU56_9GAMM|nr:proton-conducting transporter membrane subunit [Azotobacter beijerinckii]SFK60005.1 NADH-Ubiquinone oxidoreductase (complex I), chain 5 N-terminus [Azotobacter beijerinckii]
MAALLQIFIFLPLLGFLVSLTLPERDEARISRTAFVTVGAHLAGFGLFLLYWAISGFPTLELKEVDLFRAGDYEFFIDFLFDRITATYVFVGAFLTFMVLLYSRHYMHREAGYKRFFSTVLFFYAGYNMVVFSGNMETMFTGWEVLGITSFLLIAFYRDRYLPVKNAVKVFSIYRIGDIGLLLAMWMMHHLFDENVTFHMLENHAFVLEHLQSHAFVGALIALMILVAAAAKSAQLPFSSWLPRAMEGPTPSSAIFYGSLSVHIGVFLLLRSAPFWRDQLFVCLVIGLLGFATSVVASVIARSQSAIKSQIAYASIAQIGLIFIEIAAGFDTLALVHFAGNAFLRTYQLLVSPSVVTYLIREQFYNFVPRVHKVGGMLPKKLVYSLYMLSVREFNLDAFMYRYLWNPMKRLGNRLDFLTFWRVVGIFVPLYLLGLYFVYNRETLPGTITAVLPLVFSLVAAVLVLKSFTERKRARMTWLLAVMTHFWIALAISFNENFDFSESYLYLSGVAIAGVVGFLCLRRLKLLEGDIDLDRFHGHSWRHPKIAFVFLLCCLCATGFPISPTFVGEDLMFAHIQEGQVGLAFLTSFSFIIVGLSIIRIYARVFLGPHAKSVYEMAYKSS